MNRFTASERLGRLLAVIPWVVDQDGVSLDDVSARFGYPRERLEADLLEVVQYVGVYPFTPDTMIEVDIVDDIVWIRYADWFTRPLRLEPAQAVALLAAGQSMLAVAGDDDGPLLRGLTKLGAAMGAGDGTVPLEVKLGEGAEEVLAVLREAVRDHRMVDIDHYVYSRDEWVQRRIEPHRFFADEGQWYVAGHCHLAEDQRVFRVDRIRHAALTDERFEPPHNTGGGPVFDPSDATDVRLRLASPAAWVADQYPNRGTDLADDGSVEVLLPVTGRSWLERLLVRLGPDAQVLDPGEFGRDLVGLAAARILDRYR
ncbi:MAG: WYL domain-containing protein [Acidimicrobiia bacterium]|nr:WYL domain-containing protein [Acidimicrobiia bacterium]